MDENPIGYRQQVVMNLRVTRPRWAVVSDRSDPVVYSKCKVIITKHVIEVRTYEKAVVKGKKNNGGRLKGERSSDGDKHRQDAVKRTREAVRQLVTTNFDKGSKFITLTFKDGSVSDVKNISECHVEFKKFIQRLRYRYGSFRYLAVVEFQDKNGRGAVHYHMISDLTYVPQSELMEIWDNGLVWINQIEHVDNVGAYVVKYMIADTNDDRLRGYRAFYGSKNLERPTILDGDTAEAYALLLDKKKQVYHSEYESEHLGKICYAQYNLIRAQVTGEEDRG